MSDIVERLRDPTSRWMALSEPDPLRLEAADVIERLRIQNRELAEARHNIEHRLNTELCIAAAKYVDLVESGRRECERLRSDLTREQGQRLTDNMATAKQIVDLEDKIERLRAENAELLGTARLIRDLDAEIERLKGALEDTTYPLGEIEGLMAEIGRLQADGQKWMEIAGQAVADQHAVEAKIARLTAVLRRALAVAETGHWRDKAGLSLEAHPLWDEHLNEPL